MRHRFVALVWKGGGSDHGFPKALCLLVVQLRDHLRHYVRLQMLISFCISPRPGPLDTNLEMMCSIPEWSIAATIVLRCLGLSLVVARLD